MNQRKPFNYAQFLNAFRSRCADTGVDPHVGASSFDVVHFRAAQQQSVASDWWQSIDLWLDAAPYHDAVEEEAIGHLRHAAFANTVQDEHPKRRHRRTDAKPEFCPYCGAGARYQHFWQFNSGGRQYVCTQCNRHYTPGRGKRLYSEELRDRAYQLHQAGLSYVEIAAALKIHRQTVSNWMREYGVTRKAPPSPEVRQQALALAEQGISAWQIAKQLDLPRRTISSWIANARHSSESDT